MCFRPAEIGKKKCPECGADNKPIAKMCAECGADLMSVKAPVSEDPATGAPAPPVAPQAPRAPKPPTV